MERNQLIPVVDLAESRAADQIGKACREHGFFYIVGHDVSVSLQAQLEDLSRKFFTLPVERKLEIAMDRAGRAWRGYFLVGNELTSGKPDQKEGIYFGAELDSDHASVRAEVPMHGPNLFPPIEGFREVVLSYIDALTELGHRLVELLSRSLGLESNYFAERYTADPLVLFRIFHYPPIEWESEGELWSVGEHTDYGLLTILRQDQSGGLQVKSNQTWIEATPIENSFVCNIGDMLDRMTAGFYRSTPHRVRNRGESGRLSFPFFFDPNFNASVEPIDPSISAVEDRTQRWDGSSLRNLNGTYGDYLLGKVSKVFPQLSRTKL